MYHKLLLVIACLLAMASCSRSSHPAASQPTFIEFRLALRDRQYQSGDHADSGSFTQPYQTLHLPVRVPSGPGESSAHYDGVWVDIRWDKIVETRRPQMREPCLVIYGFSYCIRGGIRTDNLTRGEAWIGPMNISLSATWDHFLTPTSISPTLDRPVLVQQWRWTNPSITGPRIDERLALHQSED